MFYIWNNQHSHTNCYTQYRKLFWFTSVRSKLKKKVVIIKKFNWTQENVSAVWNRNQNEWTVQSLQKTNWKMTREVARWFRAGLRYWYSAGRSQRCRRKTWGQGMVNNHVPTKEQSTCWRECPGEKYRCRKSKVETKTINYVMKKALIHIYKASKFILVILSSQCSHIIIHIFRVVIF